LDFGTVAVTQAQEQIVSPRSKIQNPRSKILTDSVIWVIVLGALAFRILYNLALHSDGHPPTSFVIDEREYFGAAHVLAEGRGFSFFDTALWVRPPLYVLFLALFSPASDSNTSMVMIVQSLLSAVTLLPLAWLAERVGGLRAARWAALFGALYLPFTLFAGLVLSETLFVLVFALALVVLVKASEALRPPPERDETTGQRHGVQISAVIWAGLAGMLLGLAALTRATALGFVPLAALWLFFSVKGRARRGSILAAATMLAACVLMLVPWAVRNYRAYGQFVLVDTTSGYNLWLGSVGVRDEERLQNDLRPLRDPVERQSFAYARAWENIRHDPLGFAGKGFKEGLDLWRPLFSAEERQVSGYTLGRVPAWHLYALFLLDDVVYLLIILFAIVGLFLAPPHPLKSLTVLWVLLWVAMSFIFFAVTRFRLPVVAALVPWAGVGVACLFPIRSAASRVRRLPVAAQVGGLVLAAAAVIAILPPIVNSLPLVGLGAERWAQQAPFREAEWLLYRGDATWAIPEYGKANPEVPDTRYGLAAALLQNGQLRDALAILRDDEPADRFEPFLLRGEAARRSGDLDVASSLFNDRTVKMAGAQAVDWAWGHLNPPLTDTLEIGSGLDLGYIKGFYGPEMDEAGRTFRWTGKSAALRNVVGEKNGPNYELVWSGWRPEGAPPPVVEIISKPIGDTPPTHENVTLDTAADWRVGSAPVPVSYQDSGFTLGTTGLDLDAFVPGGSDMRLLGVRMAEVRAP
jgi:4-amino-4-deoxy-L-arabinose transferase-like glycosyltransferase